MKSRQTLFNGLNFMWLELTQQCNLFCVHCYSDSSPHSSQKSLPLTLWYKIIEDGRELGCKNIQFIGGEPTFFPHLLDVIIKAKKERYEKIELFTNATNLSDEFLESLKENGVVIATSFYSFDPQIHDSITQTKGSFSRTLSNIEKIIQLKIPLRIGIILLPMNTEHFIQTKQFLIKIGVGEKNIGVDCVRGQGRGKSMTNNNDEYDMLCGHCWNNRLAISSDGNVFPCVFARNFILGNALTDKLEDIIKKESCCKFREDVYRRFNVDKQPILQCQPYEPCFPLMGCPPDPCNPNLCNPGWECDPARQSDINVHELAAELLKDRKEAYGTSNE